MCLKRLEKCIEKSQHFSRGLPHRESETINLFEFVSQIGGGHIQSDKSMGRIYHVVDSRRGFWMSQSNNTFSASPEAQWLGQPGVCLCLLSFGFILKDLLHFHSALLLTILNLPLVDLLGAFAQLVLIAKGSRA